MTAREAYARLVYEDATMQGLGFTQARVWAANALDTPDRDGPFIVVSSEGDQKVFGLTGRDTVSYWVHLPRELGRDYQIIDLAIEQIKMLMDNVAHLVGTDGWSLTAASWIDTSRDLTDEGLSTLTKFVTFNAATRSLITP